MDGQQFDRLVSGMTLGLNRRRALCTLVAGTAALVGERMQGSAARKRGKRVAAEGPCGNGSIKANRCKHDGQCCTGFCDKKKGKPPFGRCRCRKLGQSCHADRNCCATAGQPMTCQNQVCVTTDSPVCDAGEATCPVSLANTANGGCCLQDVACCNGDADCSDGQTCASGCCQNICRTAGRNGVIAGC